MGLLFPSTVGQPIESTIIFLTALSDSLDFGLLLEGQEVKELKSIRGGSWGDYSAFCRSAVRNDYHSNNDHDNRGFRIVVREYKNGRAN